MNATIGMAGWTRLGPHFHSLLRMVAAFMFMQAGMVKLFAIPIAMPGGGTAAFMTQIWIGAVLEFVGGGLILLGWFTRPVAFLLAGEMAVAYFQFHFPKGFWPAENGGMPAVLYCFLFLYYSAAGAGIWSVDSWLHKRKRE